MAEYAVVPLIAKHNAGMPKMGENGQTVFDMKADAFTDFATALFDAGAHFLGGCCGTSPEHIAKQREALQKAGKTAVLY